MNLRYRLQTRNVVLKVVTTKGSGQETSVLSCLARGTDYSPPPSGSEELNLLQPRSGSPSVGRGETEGPNLRRLRDTGESTESVFPYYGTRLSTTYRVQKGVSPVESVGDPLHVRFSGVGSTGPGSCYGVWRRDGQIGLEFGGSRGVEPVSLPQTTSEGFVTKDTDEGTLMVRGS